MPDFQKQCDVYQGYNFQKDKQTPVGFVTSLKIGDTEITADTTCKDPTSPDADLKTVGVLNGFMWGVGVTDGFYLSGQVSAANKQKLMQLLYKDMTKVDVVFNTTVYEYDPLEKKYFKCFLSDSDLNGILEKNGGELTLSVADDSSPEVQSPENYAFYVGIKPQPKTQSVTVATGFTAKVVKSWGMDVSG